MENRTIIIYQSTSKQKNSKLIADTIAKELQCEAIDVSTHPTINLEQYNIVIFGSGIYFWSFGRKLKKWIRSIKWSNENVCKPDAFVFSTQGATNASAVHKRFQKVLTAKGVVTISSWACKDRVATSDVAIANLKQWLHEKIKVPKPSSAEQATVSLETPTPQPQQ